MTFQSHLLAREVHRHDAAPDAIFVSGYDSNSDNQVVWAVVTHLDSNYHQSQLLKACAKVAIHSKGSRKHSWCFGIAYMSATLGIIVPDDTFDPVRLDAAAYAALVREAGAR